MQKEHIKCTLFKLLFIGLYKNLIFNLSLQFAKDFFFIFKVLNYKAFTLEMQISTVLKKIQIDIPQI